MALAATSRVTFEATLYEDKAKTQILDLTNKTVDFKYSIDNAGETTRSATIMSVPGGVAEYQMVLNELQAGEIRYEWIVTDTVSSAVWPSDKMFKRQVRDLIA